MDVKYDLPKETLEALKEELGHGGIGLVADRGGFHRNEVSAILNGHVKIGSHNEDVIKTIQQVIREQREEAEEKAKKMTDSINKTLSE